MKKYGYDWSWYSLDYLYSESGNDSPIDFSKGQDVRAKLKQYIKRSRFLSVLFNLRTRHRDHQLVKSYMKLGRKPDIVVFHENNCAEYFLKHNPNSGATKVLLWHQDDGIRMKMELQSYPKLQGGLFAKWLRKRACHIDHSVDGIVHISHIANDCFRQENPDISQSKLWSFHNGIDDSPIVQREKVTKFKYNLCTTGTVCHRKGQYLIVEALGMLTESVRSKIHVSIIGTGNDLSTLVNRVAELGISENITFCGVIPNSEVHNYLCGCDIYILMSNSEGLPISIIEGMRAGLGVISTPVAGIPEMVGTDNGLLIEPDANQLANVLQNIDHYDWEQLGKNSRKKFEEEYTFTHMLASYCDVLDKLTAR
ncbi:MAG: glycosyltransferase family 4 protein [Bacteroidales bacterium]|nr:glycosyltransferase family 4 protein [Bacteroidales bacterium]